MLVDLMLPAAEKIVLVLEAIGDDKIWVNSTSLDHPLTILPDQVIEIVGIPDAPSHSLPPAHRRKLREFRTSSSA